MGSFAATERAGASDADDLVRLAALGDVEAFDALIATRLDRCYRLAYSILGNQADAADATQEAIVSAWRQLPRLRDQRSFDGWLNRIVANASRMSRRHRVRLREIRVERAEGPDGATSGGDPPDPAAGRDIDAIASADAIGRAFDRLREQDRSILVLHHVEERPLAEIALTLGIAVGTVKWRLHQARSALERAMEAEA
jgi:RNA polymerase sigma-70 factor (ECF subfamily)